MTGPAYDGVVHLGLGDHRARYRIVRRTQALQHFLGALAAARIQKQVNRAGEYQQSGDAQNRDIRVLALAANINRKYGGTLRNVFRSLIQSIRMREAAQRELRALTAETRFSALVLAFIPLAVCGFIFLRNRAYYTDMLATQSGRTTLVVALVLQVAGMLVIWRMMRSATEGDA